MNRHASVADFVAIALFAFIGAAWSYQTTQQVSPFVVGFYSAMAVLSVVWGRVLLVASGANNYLPPSPVWSLLVGILWTSFVLAILKLFLPIRLDTLFLWHSLAGVAAYVVLSSNIADWRMRDLGSRFDLASFVFSLAAATLWMQHLSPLWLPHNDQWEFRFFIEYFAHTGNTLPLVRDGAMRDGEAYPFSGEPLAFYHWASWTIPALAHQIAGLSVLEVQSAVWYPLGLVLVGLAAHALGSFWFGPQVGFWATVAVLAIPDPTYWSAPIVAFSFDRMLEASCAMSYTIAAAVVTLVVTTLGARHGRKRLLAIGVIGAFAAAYFKVNILVLLLPGVFLVLLFASPIPMSPRVLVVAAGFLALVLAAYFVGSSVRSAPTFRPDPNLGSQYLQWLAEQTTADSWLRDPFAHVAAERGMANAFTGALLILLATLQWWTIPVGILLSLRLRRPFGDGHVPYLLLTTIVVYALLAVLLHPNENGDPFELQHRSFVWVYFLVIVWCVGEVALGVDRYFGIRDASALRLGFACLAFPLVLGRSFLMPHEPQFVDSGQIACAEFLRTTPRDDVIVDSRKDPLLVSLAISERRSFVCYRDDYNFPGQGRLRELRLGRGRDVNRLLSLSNADEIREWANDHGVDWCLLHPDTPVQWPPIVLERADFQFGGYRVVNLRNP